MPFDRNGAAGALDAIREAISMYMGLRQTRIGNERNAEQDRLQNERYDRQQKLSEDTLAENKRYRQSDDDRMALQYIFSNYGGQPIDTETANKARSIGLGPAIEPEMTLPGRRMAPAMMASPQDQPGFPMAAPTKPDEPILQAPTGRELIRPTNSERLQIANANRDAAGSRYQQTFDQRGNQFDQMMDFRYRQLAQSADLARASQELRRIGINMSQDQLALAIARHNMQVPEQAFNDALRLAVAQSNAGKGPQAWLALFGADSGLNMPPAVQFPTPPMPSYFNPAPGPNNPLTPRRNPWEQF